MGFLSRVIADAAPRDTLRASIPLDSSAEVEGAFEVEDWTLPADVDPVSTPQRRSADVNDLRREPPATRDETEMQRAPDAARTRSVEAPLRVDERAPTPEDVVEAPGPTRRAIARDDAADRVPSPAPPAAPLPSHLHERLDEPNARSRSIPSVEHEHAAHAARTLVHDKVELDAKPEPTPAHGTRAQGESEPLPPAPRVATTRTLALEPTTSPSIESQTFRTPKPAPVSTTSSPPRAEPRTAQTSPATFTSEPRSEPEHAEPSRAAPSDAAPTPTPPRVHIGRLEVIVLAPAEKTARTSAPAASNLASRRYLRNA
jgi:hypothetical protein